MVTSKDHQKMRVNW